MAWTIEIYIHEFITTVEHYTMYNSTFKDTEDSNTCTIGFSLYTDSLIKEPISRMNVTMPAKSPWRINVYQ